VRRTEKVQVPAREEERLVGYACDVCGTTCGEQCRWPSRRDNSYHAYEETDLSIGRSTSYPEGGSSYTENWDICPACFDKPHPTRARGAGRQAARSGGRLVIAWFLVALVAYPLVGSTVGVLLESRHGPPPDDGVRDFVIWLWPVALAVYVYDRLKARP